ncbi:MAG: ABC transporter permease [Chloroflexota bacterium]
MLDNILMALDNLRSNLLRTALTMLGVTIGVAAVIILLSVGQSFETFVRQQFEGLGVNLVFVIPNFEADDFQPLTFADADALANPSNVPDATLIMPQDSFNENVRAGANEARASVTAVTPAYPALFGRELGAGRFFDESELETNARVAVLEQGIALQLFPDSLALGQAVRIRDVQFTVIGVMSVGSGLSFASDDGIYIPITTAQTRLNNNRVLSGEQAVDIILVQARAILTLLLRFELLAFYQQSLVTQSAEEASKSPVHQLFYHRLTGGRLDRFYADERNIRLPDGVHKMVSIRDKTWIINGQVYNETLNDMIQRAIRLHQPAQPDVAIVGHGDAHNGNVFFRKDDTPPSMLYFDPAFAGKHHPLLDLTKPLFHNVFAMWMYFPQDKKASTQISMQQSDTTIKVAYEYALPAVRHMFLDSKIERTLIPILRQLKAKNQLRDDWRAYLKASLFCCPLLTMNLADNEKFPPEISLLGLAMSVEMGSESERVRSLIDQKLDEVEQTL